MKFYPIVEDIDGLETSMLGLHFIIKTRHFRKGDLKFKCTATLAALYWQSNEASAEPDRPVHHQRSSSNDVYLDSHRTSTLASAALTVHFFGLFPGYFKNMSHTVCINHYIFYIFLKCRATATIRSVSVLYNCDADIRCKLELIQPRKRAFADNLYSAIGEKQ